MADWGPVIAGELLVVCALLGAMLACLLVLVRQALGGAERGEQRAYLRKLFRDLNRGA